MAPPKKGIDTGMSSKRLVALAQYALDHPSFRQKACHKKDFQKELKKEYADYAKFTNEEIAVCIGFADTWARHFPGNAAMLEVFLQHIVHNPPASG